MAADRHTHNFRKCSHASVGLAQTRPNNFAAKITNKRTADNIYSSSIIKSVRLIFLQSTLENYKLKVSDVCMIVQIKGLKKCRAFRIMH